MNVFRWSAASAIIAIALRWATPHDPYSGLAAMLSALGPAGLVLVARRKDVTCIVLEAITSVSCGGLCRFFEWPARVRDGNYLLEEALPNWISGICGGWLIACIMVRIPRFDLQNVSSLRIQFSLWRLLAAMALIGVSLRTAQAFPRRAAFPDDAWLVTVSFAAVLFPLAATAGVLIGRTWRSLALALIAVAVFACPALIAKAAAGG
ncbi:MAG: hypothetical protein ACREHD_08180 [Pirellulales bacterium]